jgi:hypothetical protein
MQANYILKLTLLAFPASKQDTKRGAETERGISPPPFSFAKVQNGAETKS